MMKLSHEMYRAFVPHVSSHLSRGGRAAAAVVLCVMGMTLGGCSMAIPVGDVFGGNDKLTTASTSADTVVLSPELTPDDWQYASIAIGTALDPVGSGAKTFWANPLSGMRGDFVAAGTPYLQGDLVCRPFNASLLYDDRHDKISGAACRQPNGGWRPVRVTPT